MSDEKGFVINSPYYEPKQYHVYDEDRATFNIVNARRPAGYFVAESGSKGFHRKSKFIRLELVNKIRSAVKTWRENNYPGITSVTRRLLEHWHDKTARPDNPFFFCQIEAIETLIFLAETNAEFNIPNDDNGTFKRLCTKLCTGGGKTIVMSMLIAWTVCNKIYYPRDKRFTRNILVVAPNLTVRKRLQVLLPGENENYYDRFYVVPVEMRDILNQARITIHNWHVLDYETNEEIAKKKSVDKRGAKSDNAYVREIFGDLTHSKNVLVINDEAHHAWRVKPNPKRKKLTDDEKEATVWIRGLDRINRVSKILTCYDFSATPFVPGMGINDEEGLFGWIVSDYSLSDGIEAGIVKTPRVVVGDNSAPGARTYMSKFFHIYADDDVKRSFNRKQAEEEELPGLVKSAYTFLGHDWKKTFDAWKEANAPTPPVMITVTNRTETASRIFYAFIHGNIDIPELCNEENILHIDSEVFRNSKDEEILREEADTVGQEGQPGANKCNIISVGMLSEGWDARTVTHIMGLRAFTSQLLCEQVVGRGLRRTSYDVPESEDGLFSPEYVNVFGVPFNFLLFGGDDGKIGALGNPHVEKTKALIKTLDERSEFIISWPNITGLEYVMRQKLSLDVTKIPELVLNAEGTIINAELAPVIDGNIDMMKCNEIDLEKIYHSMRLQNIIFKTAGEVYDRTLTEWQKKGVKLALLGQVIKLVENYLDGSNIKIYPELFAINEVRKIILLAINMERIITHIWGYITSEDTEKILPVMPQGKIMRSTEEMPSWYTARPVKETRKSHVNKCVYDSTWEAAEAYCLDKNPHVKAWVKNDHLGFNISYVYEGVLKRYLPDFLIKLENDKMLVLEVKGLESDQDKLKRERLSDWIKAVNGVKIFGEWVCDVSRSPNDIDGIIKKYI